jgi:hypothetical protein
MEKPIDLPCGGTAYFDHGSGCSHRCNTCFATVGSVGMPKECAILLKEEVEREMIISRLQGIR